MGLFFAITRPAETTTRVGPRGPARANPVLAAERFLDKMGLPAVSSRSWDELPPTDHVLIFATDERFIPRRRAEELVAWIEAGGHLVLGPYLRNGKPAADFHDDPLLELLGVGVVDLETSALKVRESLTYDPFGTGEELEVRFYDRAALTQVVDGETSPPYCHVSGRLGGGRYDVLNDIVFMQNEEIGDLDHARFLWELVRVGGPRTGVVLIHDARMRGLPALVFRHGKWALLAAGVALGALVWRQLSRFGPVRRDQNPRARSLLEHVTAAGRFFWRTRRQDVLLESSRGEVLRRARSRRARFHELDRRGQSELLAAASAFMPREIEAALFEICPHRREVFTRWMQILETLRKGL
jgi:hypothetical protein